MLGKLIDFLKILNGDVAPGQIAAGLCFGMILAFTPFWSLHTVLVIFCLCVFRINITAALIGMAVFALPAYFLDPYFIALGEHILNKPEWQALWTSLYQQDIWRLSHFNNTLTMGSIVASLALFLPSFIIYRWLIIRYRQHFLDYINRLKVVKILKASKLGALAFGLAAGK